MPKRKPGAEIKVSDGEGGLQPVEDHRFDGEPWLIELTIPDAEAEHWMLHLKAEREARGWPSRGIEQVGADENSGSITVASESGASAPCLLVAWEKPRNGDLLVRARPGGTPPMTEDLARSFIEEVAQRLERGTTSREHRHALLTYRGLPWRGELWLGDEIRLGPPSQFANSLDGPQIVILDAMVEGIGHEGIVAQFAEALRKVQVFLAVVLAVHTRPVQNTFEWVPELDEAGRPTGNTLRMIGYCEPGRRHFPERGAASETPKETVDRPGLGRLGFHADQTEQWAPHDVDELWGQLTRLPLEKVIQFLSAGLAFMNGKPMWPEQQTAYALFHVIACEALKPLGRENNNVHFYDVVASLAGPEHAEALQKLDRKPYRVRNDYVHRAELGSTDLTGLLARDVFRDPSFEEMVGALYSGCRTCLIEWLRCGGEYEVVRGRRP